MAAIESFPESVTNPPEHDCSWKNELARYDRQMDGMATFGVREYLASLITAHDDDDSCPKTAIDNQPTIEWAEFVDLTRP